MLELFDPAWRFPDPTREEFDHWIKPSTARINRNESLPGIIIGRLLNHQIYAAAERAAWEEGGSIRRRNEITMIDPSWWKDVEAGVASRGKLWQFNEVEIVVNLPGHRSGYLVTFYGVRLESSGLFELLPDLQPAPETPASDSGVPPHDLASVAQLSTPTKGPPSQGELERFSRLFVEHFDSKGTEDAAWRAVKAFYPDNSIGRDHFLQIFRVIRGPKSRGKTAR